MTSAYTTICQESPELLAEGSKTRFVIAGFGKFGRLALERLQNSFPLSRIIVLEGDARITAQKFSLQVSAIQGDAAALLVDSPQFHAEDLIIPMVPFNLAASYVLANYADSREIEAPEGLLKLLPNPLFINESNIVCSRADFVCPDDCPEGECCTVTGQPREPLYDLLGRLEVGGYKILVQKSSQMLPGVGGYRLGDLRDLAQLTGKGKRIIATSCKCHGILTAIER